MDAVVLAAGQGVRLDPEHPKQFLRLGGKPVLVHSLEVLDRIPEIDIVYITTSPDHKDMMEAVLRDYQLKKPRLVPGGDTRQRSVKNAL
jgi:2-C-methyl-D-erythritol 4-phosphate cytidylyltransferase